MIPRLKNFIRTNEQALLLCLSFIAVFALGFFTGQIDSRDSQIPVITIEQAQDNFTVFKQSPQIESVAGAATVETPVSCKIKGNISSQSKIYHLPGGSFYDRTDPEMCFNTEAEAQAAGFRKSQR